MKRIELTQQQVKWVGRVYPAGETLWLGMSGSGIEFTGAEGVLEVVFAGGEASRVKGNEGNYARAAVYIGPERRADLCMDEPEKRVRLLNLGKDDRVRIIKLSECAMSAVGIRAVWTEDQAQVRPVPVSSRRIEFVGDSITCGYGVDDEDCEHPFSTATEDVTKAYAYKTAMALGADYSMFSASGYGIISGYTPDPSRREVSELLPPYYEAYGLSQDTFGGVSRPQELKWDFSRYVPDLVVLNLGTNDDSYCQDDPARQREYQREYKAFLRVLREHNPQAVIVCAFGLMGDRLYPFICQACEELMRETGDERLYTVRLPEQDGSVGYAANYHPIERAHGLAAEELTARLREIMDWR